MVVHSGRWFKSTPTVPEYWLPVVAYALHNLQTFSMAQFSRGKISSTSNSILNHNPIELV
jgi:hypothetical protein